MIREDLGKKLLFFDGGMGTLLQEQGLRRENCRRYGIWSMERWLLLFIRDI